jgi:neutral ceramidase
MNKSISKSGSLKAGVSKCNITPPVGTPLAGYAFEKLDSLGIHDELWVRAIVLENDETKFALAVADVIGFDGDLVVKVRNILREHTDIPIENLVLAATHTHAGPVGLFGYKEYNNILSLVIGPYVGYEPDKCLIDITARKIAGTIINACYDMNEVRVGTLAGSIKEIGKNRRNPEDVSDPDNTVTLLESPSGPVSILYSYACHPTVLHQDNRYISADFPGYSNLQLEKLTTALPIYMTGAAGDISTRYTRREKTFREVQRFGNILAGETLKTLNKINTRESSTLSIVREKVKLPVKKLPTKEEIHTSLKNAAERLSQLRKRKAPDTQIKSAETLVEGAHITLNLLEKSRISELENINMELILLKVGDTAILFIPGEMFVQIGKKIKQYARMNIHHLHICCYANGYIGYIPTDEAFKDHDYESWAAIVGQKTESILIDTAKRMFEHN